MEVFMKWTGQVVLVFGLLCIAQGPAYAYSTFGAGPDYPQFNCGYVEIRGSFIAKESKYTLMGGCLASQSEIQVPWVSYGSHHEASGRTEELIYVNGPSPYRGQIQFTMVCAGLQTNFDPWLTNQKCGQFTRTVTGEIANQKILLDAIYARAQSRGGPLSASFPYDRQPLLAKRTNDLRVEAEALAAEMRRAEQLLQGAKQAGGPYSALIHPSVLTPTSGQIFAPQRPVAIKLAPPNGWNVTGYTINIQRKDPNGNWVNHTSIPVSAAQAHSLTGYTGFGGGAPPAFLMLPGRWRLSAQASLPNKSGSSDWIEFGAVASTDFAAPKRKTPLPF